MKNVLTVPKNFVFDDCLKYLPIYYRNLDFRKEFFNLKEDVSGDWEFKLVKFKCIYYEEFYAKILEKDNWRPANILHLFSFYNFFMEDEYVEKVVSFSNIKIKKSFPTLEKNSKKPGKVALNIHSVSKNKYKKLYALYVRPLE